MQCSKAEDERAHSMELFAARWYTLSRIDAICASKGQLHRPAVSRTASHDANQRQRRGAPCLRAPSVARRTEIRLPGTQPLLGTLELRRGK